MQLQFEHPGYCRGEAKGRKAMQIDPSTYVHTGLDSLLAKEQIAIPHNLTGLLWTQYSNHLCTFLLTQCRPRMALEFFRLHFNVGNSPPKRSVAQLS